MSQRFITSIPELTQELNLELATTTFNEMFTRKSHRTAFWGRFDLVPSIDQVQVPVLYRHHLYARESWRIELKQQ